MSHLTEEQKTEYFRRSYTAVDGLWFMKVEERMGFEQALQIDEAVWRILPKIQARALRVREIDARREAIRFTFAPDPPVHPETILTLLRSEGGRLKYLPEQALEYRAGGNTPEARVEAARNLLQRLRVGATVP